MGLLIVNIVRVMRNSDERYSWFDLEDALLQASRLAPVSYTHLTLPTILLV